MNPNIWGKSAWDFLYSVAYIYPGNNSEIDVIKYKNFFENIGDILPCKMCRENYKKHLVEIPINKYLKSNETLVEWLTKIQNLIREEKGRKIINHINKFTELKNKIKPNIFTDIYKYYGKSKSIIIIILLIFIYLKIYKIKIF